MRLKSVGVVGHFTKCSCWKCELYQISEFNHGQYIAGQQINLKKISFISYTKKSYTTWDAPILQSNSADYYVLPITHIVTHNRKQKLCMQSDT